MQPKSNQTMSARCSICQQTGLEKSTSSSQRREAWGLGSRKQQLTPESETRAAGCTSGFGRFRRQRGLPVTAKVPVCKCNTLPTTNGRVAQLLLFVSSKHTAHSQAGQVQANEPISRHSGSLLSEACRLPTMHSPGARQCGKAKGLAPATTASCCASSQARPRRQRHGMTGPALRAVLLLASLAAAAWTGAVEDSAVAARRTPLATAAAAAASLSSHPAGPAANTTALLPGWPRRLGAPACAGGAPVGPCINGLPWLAPAGWVPPYAGLANDLRALVAMQHSGKWLTVFTTTRLNLTVDGESGMLLNSLTSLHLFGES